jgi:hypothetical protein
MNLNAARIRDTLNITALLKKLALPIEALMVLSSSITQTGGSDLSGTV